MMKLPLKKVTKKLHFLQKNKMKILLPMGKNHVFFSRFSTKFKGQKSKIGLFTFFFDSKFELSGSKLDTKNDPKNHV